MYNRVMTLEWGKLELDGWRWEIPGHHTLYNNMLGLLDCRHIHIITSFIGFGSSFAI